MIIIFTIIAFSTWKCVWLKAFHLYVYWFHFQSTLHIFMHKLKFITYFENIFLYLLLNLLLLIFSDQGSLGSKNIPGLADWEGPGWTFAPPPAPPSSGWASRLAVADPADRAAACCWAAAALASCWSWRPAATAVSEDEARSVAGLGHLNLGIPMRPSCWTAPGICWTMAGIPGSPPTNTPPPIPSIAATDEQSLNNCQDLG